MGSVFAGTSPRAGQFNILMARYYSQDTTSTILTGVNNPFTCSWNIAQQTSPLITASGTNNTTFTFNASGIYHVGFTRRSSFATIPTTGDIYTRMSILSEGIEFCGHTDSSPISLASIPSVGTVRGFSNGDQVHVKIINLTNQNATSGCDTNETYAIFFTFLQGL